MCPESFAGFRFDLGPLLQGLMWFFLPIMAYISLVNGYRDFGCENNLQEIMSPKSIGGVRFQTFILHQLEIIH